MRPVKWRPSVMARWVKQRQLGIQTTAETKTYIQPNIDNYLADYPDYVRAFDSPYLLTMGEDWCRYQLLPASMHGHRVNLVNHYEWVNPKEPPLELWSGFFHCIHCKLMGNEDTFQNYSCF